MGFAATGDAYCVRGDIALQRMENCVKVADDILLFDDNFSTHLRCWSEVASTESPSTKKGSQLPSLVCDSVATASPLRAFLHAKIESVPSGTHIYELYHSTAHGSENG